MAGTVTVAERRRIQLLARRQALIDQLLKNENKLNAYAPASQSPRMMLSFSPRGTRIATFLVNKIIVADSKAIFRVDLTQECLHLGWIDEDLLILVLKDRALIYNGEGILQSELYTWQAEACSFYHCQVSNSSKRIILLLQSKNVESRTFERSGDQWRLASVVTDLPSTLYPLKSCPFAAYSSTHTSTIFIDLMTGVTVAEFKDLNGKIIHASVRADVCYALVLASDRLYLLRAGEIVSQLILPDDTIISWCITGNSLIALTTTRLLIVDLATFNLVTDFPHNIPNLSMSPQVCAPLKVKGHYAIIDFVGVYLRTLD